MNKIKVVNNIVIPYDGDDIIITYNDITFNNSGNYTVEYIDCDDIKLNIRINKGTFIHLFEYSNNSDILINNSYDVLGNLIISKFYANSNTNENIDIKLNSINASVKYNFSSISSGYDNYKSILLMTLDGTDKINIFEKNMEMKSKVFE